MASARLVRLPGSLDPEDVEEFMAAQRRRHDDIDSQQPLFPARPTVKQEIPFTSRIAMIPDEVLGLGGESHESKRERCERCGATKDKGADCKYCDN